jgi:uncharacterized membrane protein
MRTLQRFVKSSIGLALSVSTDTTQVLPSAHRATGNGIAVAGNRIMGLVSSFVAAYGNTATSVPIYVCAVLYIVMVSYSL